MVELPSSCNCPSFLSHLIFQGHSYLDPLPDEYIENDYDYPKSIIQQQTNAPEGSSPNSPSVYTTNSSKAGFTEIGGNNFEDNFRSSYMYWDLGYKSDDYDQPYGHRLNHNDQPHGHAMNPQPYGHTLIRYDKRQLHIRRIPKA